MHELSCRATRDIGAEGYHASIEYGPAGRVYLQRNIRPSIFAYDLRTHGRIIWQQVDIWPDIRPVSVEEIPREDALNLLMNRLVELLMLDARRCRADLRSMQDQAYHLVKVMLDLAGSALAFAGRYVSRYSERSRDFRDLLDASPDLCATLRDVDHFVATLEQAIACKLDPTDTCLALPDPAAATRQHTVWSLDLWLWEAQHLLGLPATTFRHTLEAYLARETLGARLKGWGKFLCHPLRPAHALSWPRVLHHLFRTSPQTLTYAAALLVQAGMAGETGPDWRQQVAVVSPVPLSAAHSGRAAQDIGALWQWLLRNN
jgi:hypothetical protein